MPTYLVTVRERVDYVLRVDAPDHARAADRAVALCIEHGTATPACRECRDVQVTDRRAIESEEV